MARRFQPALCALALALLAGCAGFGTPGPADPALCKERGCFWDADKARCDCWPGGTRHDRVPGKLEGQ